MKQNWGLVRSTAQKGSFSLKICSVDATNPQRIADLVTFTEETVNGKLHFLCSALITLAKVNIHFYLVHTESQLISCFRDQYALTVGRLAVNFDIFLKNLLRGWNFHGIFINLLEVKICPKAKKIPISDLYILRVTQKNDVTPFPCPLTPPTPAPKKTKQNVSMSFSFGS